MSSAPDLSKVVELIMQNPAIISEIQGLLKNDSESPPSLPQKAEDEAPMPKSESAATPVSAGAAEISAKARRAQLLSAMKPYVSSERAKAIDSMISISEILEVMKVR